MRGGIDDGIRLEASEPVAHERAAGPWTPEKPVESAQDEFLSDSTANATPEDLAAPRHVQDLVSAETTADSNLRELADPAPRRTECVTLSMSMVSMFSSTASAMAKSNSERARSRVSSGASILGSAATSAFTRITWDVSVLARSDSFRSTGSLGQRVRRKSKDISEEIMDIASFHGCESLLRGSHLSVILRNHARIFEDSGGSAGTYALSRPTNTIDAFISHNWCVPRWKKWLCLSFHFNLRKAFFVALAITSPLCVLSVYGMVPSVRFAWAPYPRSYVFRLLLFPTFLCVFLFYREVFQCFPSWTPIVFLDKTCIHQEDRAIQRKGIEKLGAFLCYSKTMVICYTDLYLLKLWTVYEVASFLTLQSAEQMRVIPVNFPIVFLSSLGWLYVAGAGGLWPEIAAGFYYLMHILFFAVAYGIIITFRRWNRSKFEIRERVSTFNARNCVCFQEGDRPLVYANIAILMKATQDIPPDATEEEALACFDNLVRNNLYEALISSVGRYSMRYEHAAACGIAFIVPVLDQLAGLAHGMPLNEFFSYAVWYGYTCCSGVPLTFMFFTIWTERCLQLTGWREYVYLMLGLISTFVWITSFRWMLDLMELWANQSIFGLLVFVIIFFVSAAVTRRAMDGEPCESLNCKRLHAKHNGAAEEAFGINETPAKQKVETSAEFGNMKGIHLVEL